MNINNIWNHHPDYTDITLPKFNIAPEKLPKPNRKGSSSNHHFSGAMLIGL